jgi:hypothetical protein
MRLLIFAALNASTSMAADRFDLCDSDEVAKVRHIECRSETAPYSIGSEFSTIEIGIARSGT